MSPYVFHVSKQTFQAAPRREPDSDRSHENIGSAVLFCASTESVAEGVSGTAARPAHHVDGVVPIKHVVCSGSFG